MKRTNVVQPTPVFVPFTLTVETLDEARLLAALIGNCPGSVEIALGIRKSLAYHMYELLSEFNDPKHEITITVE